MTLVTTPREVPCPGRAPARRSPRSPRAPHALGTLLVVLALLGAGCTAASGGSASPQAASSPANAAGACDLASLPGWPAPGHVATSGVIPVVASSQRVVGKDRIVWTIVNDQNQPIAAPGVTLEVAFYDLCRSATAPTETATGTFAWGIQGVRGFYITNPTFTRAGTWGAAVLVKDAAGAQSVARVMFDVSDKGTTPAIGDPAPSVKTPTLADVGGDVRKISSDPNPDPAFYQLSIDQALASKTPFVLALATPAFCKSAECGPTLDHLKQIVAQHPIAVINVEPYVLQYANGRLQPVLKDGDFIPVETTLRYGIPSEPWIFVVDGNGKVVGSFEAVVADDEVAAAIATAVAAR